jgi:antitoxin component of MazEF toxin-antitoxin module
MSDMIVKFSKVALWGNSAAVRLTSAALLRASFHVDDPVEVVAGDGEIIIRHPRPHVRLDDLLAKFDPQKHRHAPMLDDGPVGLETQ